MAVVEAAAAITATADATAGKFLVTLSNQVGGQQVGLFPYFFSRHPAQSRFSVEGYLSRRALL